MTFSKRPLVDGATLGDRLQTLRNESRLTIEDVASRLHISPKYLVAIESSRYRDLPGQVYAKQFVRRYAELLETDVAMAIGIFEQEYAVVTKTGPASRPLLTPRANTDFSWGRKYIRFIAAGIILVAVFAYIGLQVIQNFLPPQLLITQPSRDIATKQTTMTITGKTDPNATVTINDEAVQTTAGSFTLTIDLHTGLNTLKISAIKKHSSARVVIRQVLVE